jgi:hypothetical protein
MTFVVLGDPGFASSCDLGRDRRFRDVEFAAQIGGGAVVMLGGGDEPALQWNS